MKIPASARVSYRYANDVFLPGQVVLNTLEGRHEGDVIRLRAGVADVPPKPIGAESLAPALRSDKVRVVCFKGLPLRNRR